MSFVLGTPVNRVDLSGHADEDIDGPGCYDEECRKTAKEQAYRFSYNKRLKKNYPNSPDWLLFGTGDRTGVGDFLGSFVRVGYLFRELTSGSRDIAIQDLQHNWGEYLNTMSIVVPGPDEPLKAYEVGSFKDLQARSTVGDGFDLHHAPQKHSAGQVLPNYNEFDGPAVAIPHTEHLEINQGNTKGSYTGTPLELFETTLNTLADKSGMPPSAFSELQAIWHSMWPNLYP